MESPSSVLSPKKRKRTDNQDVIDTNKLQEKINKKYKSEEEELSKIISSASDADETSSKEKKKKKKKNKEQEEEELHILPEDSVNGSKKKKKQKEILYEESIDTETADQQDGETDCVLLGITTKKKKKKKTQERDEEEIHSVLEESVIETTNQQAAETDSGLSLESNSKKKKKKKKKEKRQEQGEEEIHFVPEGSGTETKTKKKEKQTLCEDSVDTETADQSGGETELGLLGINKKKKNKKRKEKEEMHAVEVDSENEGTGPTVLAETNSEKKKKKRRRQEQEEIHTVEEEGSVIENLTETRDDHAEDTDPAALAETNSAKKKKRRKGEQVEEEMHAVEHQNNTLPSAGTQMEVKKVKRNKKESPANIISKKRTKKVGGNGKTNVATKKKVGQNRGSRKTGQRDSPADDVFDSKLLDEMEEFLPNIRKLSDGKISRCLRLDLPRFKQFKKEGILVRSGRFTEEQNQRIRKNVADFKALIGISSDEKVVFPERFKEEEREIKRLRLQHNYVVKIAEGIPLTCDQVNCRVRKIFDARNNMGRFSDEEIQTLVKLQNLHGNNWKMISEIMGRSIYSLEKRFSTHCKTQGAWGADEESRLKKAVRDHLEDLLQKNPKSHGLSRDQLCDNLPWMVISQKVKTRHWTQCRLKWFSLLKTKLGTAGKSTFNRGSKARQAKIRLINTLHNMAVEDPAEIDWHEVAEAVGGSTPVCIQKTFHRLKRFQVPHWPSLSFEEIIDFLHGVIVPKLEKGLNCHDDDDDDDKEEQQLQERIYQPSDVFGSNNEEELEDLDTEEKNA